jgi:hypothetical protein
MPTINKAHVLSELKEAAEELERTIRALKRAGYGEAELSVAMEHIYHHLNTAWNAKHLSASRIRKQTDGDFNKWGAYPKDLPPMTIKGR